MHPFKMRRVAFDLTGDPVHHVDGFHRPGPSGGFGGQHHRVGSVIHGIGHVGHFGAGRRGGGDHRFEHLRCHNHRLSRSTGQLHDALLRGRHLLRRQLHAKVAARHHHCIRQFDNLRQPLHRRRLFDLGQQRRLPADQLPGFGHILGSLHKGQRNPVHPVVEGKGQIAPILLGQRRHRHHNIGNIQPLVVGQGTADFNQAFNPVGMNCRHPRDHFPVIKHQPRARLQGGEQFLVGQLDPVTVPRGIAPIKGKGLPAHQFNPPLGKTTDPKFWPLQIRKNGHWPTKGFFQAADIGDQFAARGLAAVAHIDPEGIGTGAKQPGNHLRCAGGGAQRCQHPDLAGARTGPILCSNCHANSPVRCRFAL